MIRNTDYSSKASMINCQTMQGIGNGSHEKKKSPASTIGCKKILFGKEIVEIMDKIWRNVEKKFDLMDNVKDHGRTRTHPQNDESKNRTKRSTYGQSCKRYGIKEPSSFGTINEVVPPISMFR